MARRVAKEVRELEAAQEAMLEAARSPRKSRYEMMLRAVVALNFAERRAEKYEERKARRRSKSTQGAGNGSGTREE